MSTSADDSAVMVCVDGSPASDASVRRAAASRSASPGCQRIAGEVVISNQYLEHICEATLLDGGLVSLRRLDWDDLDGIIALSETLTESERYLRFFTAHPTLKSWAKSLAERSNKQFALGAFESGRLIGVASYFMCNEPGCAEVAIVVAHQEHMRGVGTVLLGRLGQIARDNGLDRLVADVLTENYLMRKVMSDAGWPCTIHADGSELQVDVNLAELAQ